MQHGFIKTAAVTPKIKVADTDYNVSEICSRMDEAVNEGAKIIVFPELCITGYTCGDLFLQELLLAKAREGLLRLAEHTLSHDALVFAGLPLVRDNKLYNAAAALQKGKILGFIPKASIPAYAEFYEGRHFTAGNKKPVDYVLRSALGEERIPFGTNLLFDIDAIEGLRVGCEICEDIWVPNSPANSHALAGATVIVNLSASNESAGKDEYRELLVKSASARTISGYIYCSAGEGESTQDLVFGGHNIIAENGTVIRRTKRFTNEPAIEDIDIHKILHERRRMSTYTPEVTDEYRIIPLSMKRVKTDVTRKYANMPFVPPDKEKRKIRCEEILSIQSYGLKKRYEHTGCRRAVLGISGGLDSTLALLVTARAFDMLSLQRRDILCVTMPCFGTTDRTYNNACNLTEALHARLMKVDIKAAVTQHFEDIQQDMGKHDAAYENGQARERTQVLMDLANKESGMVIGTGDMSELALGWATYNGDHMSMYGVNAGVPKTLVRYLVEYYADTCENAALKSVLEDVLNTPVSPELLPPVNGSISQKTEELVGPYELHDFFLYYMLRFGFEPEKIYRVAKISFLGQYTDAEILNWLKTFYRRFFSQQFKRSCLPDGPKVGSVALSPRGDLRMPSDACVRIWMEQLEGIK